MILEATAEYGLMKISSTTELTVVALAVRRALAQSRLSTSGEIVGVCLMHGGC
jgi:hypothetical protein